MRQESIAAGVTKKFEHVRWLRILDYGAGATISFKDGDTPKAIVARVGYLADHTNPRRSFEDAFSLVGPVTVDVEDTPSGWPYPGPPSSGGSGGGGAGGAGGITPVITRGTGNNPATRADSGLANRRSVTIKNTHATQDMYIGFVAGVTNATGFILAAGETFSIDLPSTIPVYVYDAGAIATFATIES